MGTAVIRKSRLLDDGEKRDWELRCLTPISLESHWEEVRGKDWIYPEKSAKLTCQEREEAEVGHAAGKLR